MPINNITEQIAETNDAIMQIAEAVNMKCHYVVLEEAKEKQKYASYLEKNKELTSLSKELDDFDKQLDELFIDKGHDSLQPNPESQLILENLCNKISNYINYSNELNLFQMNININQEGKESLFDSIQKYS